ncbi:MAG: energy-coupling factor ABC transporter ATP-binding protein [Halanaerobiaceae bacterium]
MNSPLIKCENLEHVYPGEVKALQDASLEVKQGEIVGIIGQNGSGKTTLVKHFNGLLKPTEGKVIVNGVDTRDADVKELSRITGYVFQNPNHQLFANSVKEELEFGPKNLEMSEEEVEDRVEMATDFFGLKEHLGENPYRLSFPLRKMVGIASIYAMDPDIFVFDEPTTGQDYSRVKLVSKLIKKLQDEGYTVLIVSHDMILIAECCTRLVALWNSRIIGDDVPRNIFSDKELLKKTNLTPPQIFQLAEELNLSKEGGIPLSIDEAVIAAMEGK